MAIDAQPRSTASRPVPPQPPPTVATTALGLLVATIAGGALVLGLATRAFSLATGSSVRTVDSLLEVAVCGLGAVVAAWLAASALLALACLTVRLIGSSWRLGERLVHRCAPAVVRRALVLVVGATVGLGAVTGASASVAPSPGPTPAAVSVAVDDLGWIVTTPAVEEPAVGAGPTVGATVAPTSSPSVAAEAPSQPAPVIAPVGATAAAPVAASGPTEPAPAPLPPTPSTVVDEGRVVVAAGDSLWAIAARHLGPDATDAQIAASWPRWYHANAAVIGPDPSHIVPGQELVVPIAQDGGPS